MSASYTMPGLTHKAAVLYGPQDLRIQDVETVLPEPHQVQLRIRATGICGTDMHYFQNAKNGIFVVKSPLILGHEAAGEIVAVGNASGDFKIGDRVVFEPQRPCETCRFCRRGVYNLCPNMKFTGSASANPPVQGSLQQLYNHSAKFVYKLPESISWEEAAVIEPLAVAIHAINRSDLRTGQSVLVIGAGAVGLLCASVARVAGASRVTIVDIEQSRLNFATGKVQGVEAVADDSVLIPMKAKEGEAKEDFATRTAGMVLNLSPEKEQFDVVFECTGVESCVNTGIHAVRSRGKVVLVGMGAPMQSLHIGAAAVREVDLLGLWRYSHTFEPAIDLVRSGRVNLKSMVTHQYSLENAAAALCMALARPQELVKCVIVSE